MLPMRVLLAISKYLPEYSGAAIRLHRTYLRLQNLSPDLKVHVLAGSVTWSGVREDVVEGIPVHRIGPRVFDWWRRGRGIGGWTWRLGTLEVAHQAKRFLDRGGWDVVHVVGTSGITATAMAWASRKQCPLLVELTSRMDTPVQRLPVLRFVTPAPDLTRRTVVMAISPQLAERAREEGLVDNVWTRPNPVDETRFRPTLPEARGEARRELGVPDDALPLGSSVAQFIPRKNHAFLVDMLAGCSQGLRILMGGPDWPVPGRTGEGESLARVRHLIQASGIQDRIWLRPGFLNQSTVLRASDVYLMPAWDEGLGTPLLEALAAGVPVVANAAEPAFRFWLEGAGRGGGVLAPLEPEAWVRGIQEALRIPVETRVAVAERIRSIAGTEVIDAGYVRILTALAGSKPSARLRVASILGSEG